MSGRAEFHPLPAWRVETHESLPSTQQQLKERLADGVVSGGLVLRALEQPAGVGRRGKAWSGGPGGSYQSAALADPEGRLRRPWMTLAIAVGIAELLRSAGAGVTVKWPNDLYLGGGKLGGILTEHVRGHLVVGVGVNVENDAPIGAAALRGWRPETVSDIVLDGIRAAVNEWVTGPAGLLEPAGTADPALLERFAAIDLLQGRWVVLITPTGEVSGVARGIDVTGALLVERGGELTPVRDGSVASWRPYSGG